MVSHSEMFCIFWKMPYLSNNNKKCHELGFSIRSGLLSYLEFCIIICGSRLLPYSEFSSTSLFLHACACLCVGMCAQSFHVQMCVLHGIFFGCFLQVFRSGSMIRMGGNEKEEV